MILMQAAHADEIVPAPAVINTPEQAAFLPIGTTSVYIDGYQLKGPKAELFCSIMNELARNPTVQHLKLRIPNSSPFKDDVLDVLRNCDSMESLDLADARDWKATKIFEQVAAMKNLKKVKLSFL